MGTSLNLFNDEETAQTGRERIGAQSVVLRGFALPAARALLAGVGRPAGQQDDFERRGDALLSSAVALR